MTTRSKSARKTHVKKPAGHRAARGRRSQQTVSASAYRKPWRTFTTDAISGVMDIEEAALKLGVEYGQTTIAVLQFILWPILGRPTEMEPVGRGKVLALKTPAQVVDAAIARAA